MGKCKIPHNDLTSVPGLRSLKISQELEDLLDVDAGAVVAEAVVAEAVVAEDGAERLASGDGSDEFIGEAAVEAGGEGVLIDEEDALAVQGLGDDGQSEIDAPIDEDLEEEILGGAVGLEAIR